MVEWCQKTDSFSLLARVGIALSLLVVSIVLFALPQPNLLTVNGIPFLAYFALVPVFHDTKRTRRNTGTRAK